MDFTKLLATLKSLFQKNAGGMTQDAIAKLKAKADEHGTLGDVAESAIDQAVNAAEKQVDMDLDGDKDVGK